MERRKNQMQAQKSKDAVKDTGNLYDKIEKDFMQRFNSRPSLSNISLQKQPVISSLHLLCSQITEKCKSGFLDVIILQ
jgi:hypothetical protein